MTWTLVLGEAARRPAAVVIKIRKVFSAFNHLEASKAPPKCRSLVEILSSFSPSRKRRAGLPQVISHTY